MSLPDTRPASRLHSWVLASRPRTLPAAVAPVLVGTALAIRDGAFHPAAALAALIASVLIQIGANFANDLGDFKHGADSADRLGPTRVTSAGLLSPQTVERGMWAVFGAAALLGLYLIAVGGWPILVVGVASILAAMAYTGGPFPLGYNGLGDLFVFIFFGLVAVMGTYYVQTHALTVQALLAAIPIGALVTNILVVNNVRDVETDIVAGKRTLAVLLGRRGARAEYVLLLLAAYAVPFIFWLGYGMTAWVLLPLLITPLAFRTARTVLTSTGGPTLNRALGNTAQFAALFGLLFAVGIVI
jgi:1,4-dihydroxy-2-naphthoate polyprenyltransferase